MKELNYKKEAENIVQQVWVKYKPEKIILFGSYARETSNPESDVDLLIIKNTRKRRVARVKEVLSLIDYNIPLDPIIYTKKELNERLRIGDPFIEKIIKEGKTIYDS